MGEDVICSRSPHKLVTLKTGKSYLIGPDHCDGLTASICSHCHCPNIPAHGLSLSGRNKAPVKQPAAVLKHQARSQLGKEYKKVWKKERKAAQKLCIYECSTFLASASYSQQEQQRVLIWLLLLFAFTTGFNNNIHFILALLLKWAFQFLLLACIHAVEGS